jgi:hypothetical protein
MTSTMAARERGEQVALVSFTNIAKLASNASQELTRSGMRAPMKAPEACANGHPRRHSLNGER